LQASAQITLIQLDVCYVTACPPRLLLQGILYDRELLRKIGEARALRWS
jgi:hypothetical protein